MNIENLIVKKKVVLFFPYSPAVLHLSHMKKCSLVQKKDRISYLPDPIRSHIISFLPTKEAMRMSILSRRWEHVCSSLSNMEFHQCDFRRKENKVGDFKNFVDELIFRHDGSDIRRFSLRTYTGDVSVSSRHVNAWISFALRHNVQDFELFRPDQEVQKLPLRLFICNTLTVLRFVAIKMEWPSNIKFPMLKSFTCESIVFYGENVVKKIFSSCTLPVLEELALIWCFLYVETLSISIPTLKYLNIIEGNDTKFSVSNSTLREIDYMGMDPPKISSENLSSLSIATFQFIRYFNSIDDIARYSNFNCASKFLMGLHNVVTLHLMSGFLEFLSKDGDLLASLPSWRCGPKHLLLEMLSTGVHSQVITLLLECFPNLQTVEIYVEDSEENGISNKIKMGGYRQKKEPPADIFNQLRTVTIKNFGGGVPELDMVRYFLEKAKFLEEMKIVYSEWKGKVVESPRRTGEILSTCNKVSTNVAISIL